MADRTRLWLCDRTEQGVCFGRYSATERAVTVLLDRCGKASGYRVCLPMGDTFATEAEAIAAAREHLASEVVRLERELASARGRLTEFDADPQRFREDEPAPLHKAKL